MGVVLELAGLVNEGDGEVVVEGGAGEILLLVIITRLGYQVPIDVVLVGTSREIGLQMKDCVRTIRWKCQNLRMRNPRVVFRRIGVRLGLA